MVCDLITLPLRIAVSATRFGVQLTGRAVGAALQAAERLASVAQGAESETGSRQADATSDLSWRVVIAAPAPGGPTSDVAPESPGAEATVQRPDAAPEPAAPTVVPEPAAAPQPTSSLRAAPLHVSEEPQLVEAFAEPGAEDGAGASIHVKEPWKGYGKMTASEIIARLDGATREELADVELYEGFHRRRRTVITRARRQLQRAAATASH